MPETTPNAGLPVPKAPGNGEPVQPDVDVRALGYALDDGADGAVETPALRTLGPGPQQAAPGDDPRLADKRISPDNSVTTAQIQNGAVTPSKLSSTSTYQVSSLVLAVNGGIRWTGTSGNNYIQRGGSGEHSYKAAFHIFRSSGDVGTADGDIYYRTAFPSSSAALKTAVEEIGDPLALVRALRGVRFRWRDDGRPSMGLIAEEVERVAPEAVSRLPGGKGREDIVGINYEALVAPLIAAVQVLADQVDALRRAT